MIMARCLSGASRRGASDCPRSRCTVSAKRNQAPRARHCSSKRGLLLDRKPHALVANHRRDLELSTEAFDVPAQR